MKKVIQKVKVKNPMGLHARPATAIARVLQDCKSQAMIEYKKEVINARSIISILMLAIKKNMQVTLIAEGEDAEETMQKLVKLFEDQFGEGKNLGNARRKRA